MGVLSFRRGSGPVSAETRDWSQQDLADFYRAFNLLQRNGVAIGMDRGLSDRGEPYLVFFDTASQDVFIHVARIDGRCVLVADTLGVRLSARSVGELIGRFESAVQTLVSDRAERERNVVLHPAARVIMAITATFLLFKLENSGTAQAHEALGLETGPDGNVVRKSEIASGGRLHQALARLLETVDTPTAIATVASLLIASELTKLDLPGEGGAIVVEGIGVGDLAALKAALIDAGQIAGAGEAQLASFVEAGEILERAVVAPSEAEDAVTVSIDHSALLERVAEIIQLSAAAAHDALPAVASSLQAVAAVVIESTTESIVTVAARAPAEETGVAAASEALAALKLAIGGDALTELLDEVKAGTSIPAVSVDLATFKAADEAEKPFAYFSETHVGFNSMLDVLMHFIDVFDGGVAFQSADGNVVMEQAGAADDDPTELGVWRNVNDDGSTITIVGQADFIDDVESLLA